MLIIGCSTDPGGFRDAQTQLRLANQHAALTILAHKQTDLWIARLRRANLSVLFPARSKAALM